MTQPSGRVCGKQTNYGVWLRSSPVLCAADSVSIAIQVLYFWLFISLRGAVRGVISRRFDDVEGFASGSWLRCVYFVVGPLMSAIKLGAMQGVPWTKAYGMMFLVSFILVEGLAWFTLWDGVRPKPAQEKAERDRLRRGTSAVSEALNFFLAISASLIHLGIILWAIFELLPRPPGMGAELGALARLLKHILTIQCVLVFELGYCILLGMTFICSLLFGAIVFRVSPDIDWDFLFEFRISLPFRGFFSRMFPGIDWEHFFRIRILRLILILAFTISSFTTLFWITPNSEYGLLEPACLIFDLSILIESFAALVLMSRIIFKVAGKHKLWARQLLLLNPRYGYADRESCLALVMVLIELCVCLLWYAFRYDSAGTVNPSWTVVFG